MHSRHHLSLMSKGTVTSEEIKNAVAVEFLALLDVVQNLGLNTRVCYQLMKRTNQEVGIHLCF